MDILQGLTSAGAVTQDKHFVYKSQKHGSNYINMDAIFPDVDLISFICLELAKPYRGKFDTVVGPATGGIILSFMTAFRSFGRRPAAIWADKDGDNFNFARAGFKEHLRDKRVLIVEDLLTTGSSVKKVRIEAERCGAEVIGISAICNRGGVTALDLGVPRLETLAEVDFVSYDQHDCPLCRDAVPIVEDIGHGAEFKANYPGHAGGYVKLLD